jgi:SAM-dependent methyltransferase
MTTFLDYFSDKADLYAQARPRYPEALFQFIAATAPHTDCAWDCGAGSGQAAVSLARYFQTVYASDPSASQIERAISHPSVVYSVQPAEATNFPTSQFDAVCVAQAAHWFDQPRFFAEAKRVMKPGAALIIWGYSWFAVSPDFDAAFQTHILDVVVDDWAPENALLWNGYRDIALPFTPIPTPDLQIEALWSFQQLMAFVHTWSAVRRCMTRLGDDFFRQAITELGQRWGDLAAVRRVTMPLHILAGRSSG